MGTPKKTIFQLRNRRHFIVGTFTEQEIISRINAGKYQGDEEVSPEPYLVWQKISSHPAFYDAFLKRLFVDSYKSPKTSQSQTQDSKNKSVEKNQNSADSGANRNSASVPRAKRGGTEENAQATQQLLTKQNDSGDPIDGAKELEQLFLEAPSSSEAGENYVESIERVFEQDEAPSTEIPLVGANEEEPLPENSNPEASDIFFVSGQNETLKNSSRGGLRKPLVAAGLIVALVFLYQMGQSGPESVGSIGEQQASPILESITKEKPLNALNREELIAAVMQEATHFYEMDTPLHYKGALDLFKESAQLNTEDPQIMGWKALTQAHLFEQDPNNSKITEELKKWIAVGRRTEPHLNAFYRAEALMEFFNKNTEAALEKIGFAIESDPSDVETLVLQAEFLNSAGDREQAKIAIEKALQRESRWVRAYFVGAQIALDLGDLDSAEKLAKNALQLNQVHANTHFILAEIYLRKGNRGPAIAHLDLVTKLAPLPSRSELADAHFALAKLIEEQGNIAEASEHNKLAYYFSDGSLPGLKQKLSGIESDREKLRQLAKEQEYDVGFYNSRADELLAENQVVLGLEYLQVTRLLQPENPAPLIRVAEVLEKLAVSYEKLKRVEILYERAIKKDPNYLESYVKLSGLENEQYNFENAYRLLLQASNVIGLEEMPNFIGRGCQDKLSFSSKAKDDYKVYLAWGKHFFKRENYDCSAAFLQQAQISSPVNSEVFYYFGKLADLYKADDLQRVINYYYQAFTIDSSNYDALSGWARAKTKMGEKNYVIKYLRALIESDPQNYNLFWALGETYSENQEYQRAITFYKKALDYNPRFSKCRISLARALSAIGQTYQAINEFTYAASSDRRNGVGFFEAAQLQTINKKYQDAELLVKALIEATPNYPGSHRLLSQVYQFMGKKDEAIEEMVKETQNNPQNSKFGIDLAETYIRYQKYENAVQVLSKIVNLPGEAKAPAFRGDRTQAFLLLSRCFRALNRPDNAEGAIKLALEIDKDDPELHRELGYVYHDLQRYREGVKEFEFYLQRKPAGVDVENIKGLIKKMVIED